MSTAARGLLVDLDKGLVKLNSGLFPNPADIRAAVSTARDMLAVLLQDLEELEARMGLMEEVK